MVCYVAIPSLLLRELLI